jgi:hypothetical protein
MTRAKRDRQRGLVYAWENAVVAPCDRSEIDRADAQAMVNAIWAECGRLYPPKVLPLPVQTRTYIGRADRLTIEISPRLPSWCLLHELAHAMTSTLEGDSDGHGPAFMAAYVTLLARYLRLDPTSLRASAMRRGISLNLERRVTRSGRS